MNTAVDAAGAVVEGTVDTAGAVVEGAADLAGGTADAVADVASDTATAVLPDQSAVDEPAKTMALGQGCIVTFETGRAVISSAGSVRFGAAECDRRLAAVDVVGSQSDVAAKPAAADKPATTQDPAPATEPMLIEATAHFDFDSANLNDESRAKLDSLAVELGPITAKSIAIKGFADPTGPSEHNQALSDARAQMIAEYLASKGIDAENWQVVAQGEDTVTEQAAAARRAEILIEL